MPTSSANQRLNDLLIEIHRSLVQYAAESWLWTTDDVDDLRETVSALGEQQRQDVGRLAYFLDDRDHHVEFGVYPQEYTSLHYVAIEYLYAQLVENQQHLVELLEASAKEFSADQPAELLVREIAGSQRRGLLQLQAVRVPGVRPATVWIK